MNTTLSVNIANNSLVHHAMSHEIETDLELNRWSDTSHHDISTQARTFILPSSRIIAAKSELGLGLTSSQSFGAFCPSHSNTSKDNLHISKDIVWRNDFNIGPAYFTDIFSLSQFSTGRKMEHTQTTRTNQPKRIVLNVAKKISCRPCFLALTFSSATKLHARGIFIKFFWWSGRSIHIASHNMRFWPLHKNTNVCTSHREQRSFMHPATCTEFVSDIFSEHVTSNYALWSVLCKIFPWNYGIFFQAELRGCHPPTRPLSLVYNFRSSVTIILTPIQSARVHTSKDRQLLSSLFKMLHIGRVTTHKPRQPSRQYVPTKFEHTHTHTQTHTPVPWKCDLCKIFCEIISNKTALGHIRNTARSTLQFIKSDTHKRFLSSSFEQVSQEVFRQLGISCRNINLSTQNPINTEGTSFRFSNAKMFQKTSKLRNIQPLVRRFNAVILVGQLLQETPRMQSSAKATAWKTRQSMTCVMSGDSQKPNIECSGERGFTQHQKLWASKIFLVTPVNFIFSVTWGVGGHPASEILVVKNDQLL